MLPIAKIACLGTPSPCSPSMPGMPQWGRSAHRRWDWSQVESLSALSPIPIPLSPSGRPGDLARARRSEVGGSWLGGAQLWLVARPPLKKRLTRVLERCSPGGAPRAPCTSGFSFFLFSSGDREGFGAERVGDATPNGVWELGRGLGW